MRDAGIELLARLAAPRPTTLRLPPTLVLLAHPDDEVIGLGSRLPRLRGAVFLTITDGAPPDGRDARANGFATPAAYARARRQEQFAALALAGVSASNVHSFECPDQQASLHLATLAHGVAGALRLTRSTVVVTHPHEGGHPDHDAAAFAVHAACALLAGEGREPPAIVEMTSYHAGPLGIEVGAFLGGDGAPGDAVEAILDDADLALRRRMLDLFVTQRRTIVHFRDITRERFRIAPACDFTRPPHTGELHYDRYAWGMTGERFCALAREALEALGIAEGACV